MPRAALAGSTYGVRMRVAFVNSNRDQELALGFVGVRGCNVERDTLQLRQARDVSRVWVRPE